MREVCIEKVLISYAEPNRDFKSKFKSRFTKNDRYNLFRKLEREERRVNKNDV